ncbi:unnamed protein product, partial [marine sediment metagenome]
SLRSCKSMTKVIIYKHTGPMEEYDNAYVTADEMKESYEYVIIRSKETAEPIAFLPRKIVAKVLME